MIMINKGPDSCCQRHFHNVSSKNGAREVALICSMQFLRGVSGDVIQLNLFLELGAL